MDGWQGFSDADLLRIKRERQDSTTGTWQSPGKATTSVKSHMGSSRSTTRQHQRRQLNTQSASDLPADQRLSRPPTTSQSANNLTNERLSAIGQFTSTSSATSVQCRDNGKSKSSASAAAATTTGLTDTGPVQVDHSSVIPVTEQPLEDKELCTDEGVSRELSNLEQFQQRQKQMEELNKQKRQLLSSTIAQRKKAAKAESARLNHIQKELDKLDHLLIVDVSIIRDKIEEASRGYLNAQKRFERAEHELIEAKLELHTASDLKEQLTEHLYTVINENEMRKARKLAELMGQLEVPSEDTETETDTSSTVHMPHLIPLDTVLKSPSQTASKETPQNAEQQLPTDKCDETLVNEVAVRQKEEVEILSTEGEEVMGPQIVEKTDSSDQVKEKATEVVTS